MNLSNPDRYISHPDHSAENVVLKIETLFACSVAERYLLLVGLGTEHSLWAMLDLNGSPRDAAANLIATISKYIGGEKIRPGMTNPFAYALIDGLVKADVPEGFPDPLQS